MARYKDESETVDIEGWTQWITPAPTRGAEQFGTLSGRLEMSKPHRCECGRTYATGAELLACQHLPARPSPEYLRVAAAMLTETAPYTRREKQAAALVSDWLERMADGKV